MEKYYWIVIIHISLFSLFSFSYGIFTFSSHEKFSFFWLGLIFENGYLYTYTIYIWGLLSYIEKKMLLNQKHFFPKAYVYYEFIKIYYKINRYVTNSIAYWFESVIYMLLERNAIDSIAFFSQCMNLV